MGFRKCIPFKILEAPVVITGMTLDEVERINRDAEESAQIERELTPWKALQVYTKAMGWCLVFCSCIIAEGYGQILVPSLFAFPQFRDYFGDVTTPKKGDPDTMVMDLSAPWQAGLINLAAAGAFIGAFANGWLVDKFGHKKVVLASLIFLTASIPLSVFAHHIAVLSVGQFLAGLPWGVFATVAPAYASECVPMKLRVYVTSFSNMCFTIGQVLAAVVLYAQYEKPGDWSWRLPFALQWTWTFVLIPLVIFAPQSPWHEVRKGRNDAALNSLRQLQRNSDVVDPVKTLAAIWKTNQLEEELNVGTKYWNCFKGFDRRRTLIACMAFVAQVWSGSAFASNLAYFFEQLEVQGRAVYSLNLAGWGLSLLGALLSWIIVIQRFGRRTIFLCGMGSMALTLYIIGALNKWRHDDEQIKYAQAGLCLTWTILYQLSVGQISWALAAEMGSTRLRQKTLCIARNAYYIANVIASTLQPFIINPSAWNMGGYAGFVWGSTSALVFLLAWFQLPETKDRTYEELDKLFANRISARRFKMTDPKDLDETSINPSS